MRFSGQVQFLIFGFVLWYTYRVWEGGGIPGIRARLTKKVTV